MLTTGTPMRQRLDRHRRPAFIARGDQQAHRPPPDRMRSPAHGPAKRDAVLQAQAATWRSISARKLPSPSMVRCADASKRLQWSSAPAPDPFAAPTGRSKECCDRRSRPRLARHRSGYRAGSCRVTILRPGSSARRSRAKPAIHGGKAVHGAGEMPEQAVLAKGTPRGSGGLEIFSAITGRGAALRKACASRQMKIARQENHIGLQTAPAPAHGAAQPAARQEPAPHRRVQRHDLHPPVHAYRASRPPGCRTGW